MPALSNALSLLSSHRSGRERRNPLGGGPVGVADRLGDVENAADDIDGTIRGTGADAVHVRARASAAMYLVEAIVEKIRCSGVEKVVNRGSSNIELLARYWPIWSSASRLASYSNQKIDPCNSKLQSYPHTIFQHLLASIKSISNSASLSVALKDDANLPSPVFETRFTGFFAYTASF